MVMTNDFFGGMQKSQFHFVYTPCRNGTWAMYEWYMANVRNLTPYGEEFPKLQPCQNFLVPLQAT